MYSKILIYNEDESLEYVDYWFDENEIKGYYITKDNYEDESVNIILGNMLQTVLRNKELIDFLLKKYNM